jgi:hypothetical protein
LQIKVTAFTTFDAKEKQRPDEKQIVMVLHHPEQSAKCAEGRATEGSAA